MKKVNFLCLLILGLMFASCHSSDDTRGDWSKASEFPGRARVGAVSFTIGDATYVGLGFNRELKTEDKTLIDFWKFKDGNWSRVADFPAQGRYGAVAFVIGNKAYVGTGMKQRWTQDDSEVYYNDFYVFDGTTDKWTGERTVIETKDKNEVGMGRTDAVAFSFAGDTKGYVGTGKDDGRVLKDFWVYDQQTDSWETTSFPGESRCGAVAFVIDDKAVVCLGSGSTNSASSYKTDVLVFDRQTGEWSSRAPLVDRSSEKFDDDYTKIPRSYAVAFVSSFENNEKKGYIATGQGTYPKTCWEYYVNTDRWVEVTELPALMSNRVYAVGFTQNNYGYVTVGGSTLTNATYVETWKFTPGIDEDENNDYTWTPGI